MPRGARRISKTGIYHVVLRGINKQRIFEDDEDYKKFLYKLKDCKKKSGYELYAYCLMNNHVHLLIKEGYEELGTIFRRIGASYVYWYNWKYNRRGHLFQDRYKREIVEGTRYFLTVVRYIHQNPLKAGIVKEIKDYAWSSFREYTEKKEMCSTSFALDLFSRDREKALEQFKEFNSTKNDDQCMEYDNNGRLNDSEAAEIIKTISGARSPFEIQSFAKERRDEVLKMCRYEGLSIRQIERLTGISFGVIRKV